MKAHLISTRESYLPQMDIMGASYESALNRRKYVLLYSHDRGAARLRVGSVEEGRFFVKKIAEAMQEGSVDKIVTIEYTGK